MKIAINHQTKTITTEHDSDLRAIFCAVSELWRASNACPGDPPVGWLWADTGKDALLLADGWRLQTFQRGRFVMRHAAQILPAA